MSPGSPMTTIQQSNGNGTVREWQSEFLLMMPAIRRHAQTVFRHLCRQERDEALAEVVALAMIDYLELMEADGPEPCDAARLAQSASSGIQRGERAWGQESSSDVLSPLAQYRRGFRVERIKDSCEAKQLHTRIDHRRNGSHRSHPSEEALEGAEGAEGAQGAQGVEGVEGAASPQFAQERTLRRQAEKRLRATENDFQVARRIQEKLLPGTAPALPGFDIAGLACPADATGGDYFDYVPMMNSCVGVVVGDVCGHGFGPALLMASTRAYLRAFAQTQSDLADLLSLVNRVLTLDIEDDRFVTLALARLDPQQRSLVYASAGHPSGYVLDPYGRVRLRLASTGPPLGLGPDAQFAASPVIPLEPRELVLLLSDGVTEASAPDGTAFGSSRAVDIVRIYRHEPAARIVRNLLHAVRAFCQNAAQLDDITVVVIKVRQDGSAPTAQW